jgi:hypothetical protein
MGYRNKTYVIFDGDSDMWAYAYMKGWKANERLEFDFHDVHDLNVITDRASEETVKRKLRERFGGTKHVIVLIGENTRNLFRFVRWEIDVAQGLDLPIIAVNLDGGRRYDSDRCPPILRDQYVVHVAFKAKIIQYALDHFPDEYDRRTQNSEGNRHYPDSVYQSLGL